MSTTQYAKPFLDEGQQVALLASRGLSVSDPKMAAEFLTRVNYYRLSGYAIPFLIDREHFKPDASFDDLMAVYRFDRVLRDLLFEALEAAELSSASARFEELLCPPCTTCRETFLRLQPVCRVAGA